VWYFWLWITAWVNIGNKSKHSIKIIVSKYFALTAVITSYHLLSFSIIKRFFPLLLFGKWHLSHRSKKRLSSHKEIQ